MKSKTNNQFLLPTLFGILILLSHFVTFAQKETIELSFTAIDSINHVQLDSIKVINRSQGNDTTLYWPDTVLSLYFVGINETKKYKDSFQVFQNYPNPTNDFTTVTIYIPKRNNVKIIITDLLGQQVIKEESLLEKGYHSYKFTPGESNIYFFSIEFIGETKSISILHNGSHYSKNCSIKYTGYSFAYQHFKMTEDIQSFSFNLGDELLYTGFAYDLQAGILDKPESSGLYVFQFATNIPCPETPTVQYEGQLYNTIQIFNQCWLKENLNVGEMIPGTQEMSNNSIIEKYCFGNYADSCQKFGGLYSWWEMMQYNSQQGSQGICPPGWHIPSDDEWKILEGSVDSQFGIGSITWDMWGLRGSNAGENLKSETSWRFSGNGTDLFGFTALEGGMKWGNSNWFDPGRGYWWSSSTFENSGAWYRILDFSNSGVRRNNDDDSYALSVRCIKDY